MTLLLLLGAAPALGQFRLLGGSAVFGEGESGGLFVAWEGSEYLSEASLRLPQGWKLVEAAALQRGRYVGVSWTSANDEGSYRIAPDGASKGPIKLVLKVEAPDYPSGGFWSLTPAVAPNAGTKAEVSSTLVLREHLVTERVRIDRDNLVAVFDGRSRIELRGRGLPVFTGDRSYTVEFWLKTTGLGEILLSTWNGDEASGYPIEVVTAPDGRLQYFRGEPGRHLSMSSEAPVADGRWHHVAIVHDEVRGWTRMLVDGAPTDSLSGHTDVAQSSSLGRLCLGGRCETESLGAHRGPAYRGKLDLVRFWPTARTARQVEASMSDDIPQVAGMLALSFDRSMAQDLVVSGADIPVEPSDFLFYDPVEDLAASMDGNAVLIEWESGGRNTSDFLVERSTDGVTFVEIGRIEAERRSSYLFTDHSVSGDVVYYRVQQVLSNGGTRSSGTLKLGLGGQELPSAISSLLVDNFPNPFSGQTTVRFQLLETEDVSVSVWDLSGHQVAVLADGVAGPGIHEVLFEAGDLPSGTYFVRLQTDEGVSTRTLTLMR